MLKKYLCKKCVEEQGYDVWDKHDERNWEEFGEVICSSASEFKQIPITGKPPEDCPYFLEHRLAEQENL